LNTFKEIPASKSSLSRRKLVYGFGTNDAGYIVGNGKNRCSYYGVWVNMLMRCYSDKFQESNPTYIGCVVCENWLTFSNFKEWMSTKNWNNNELDKDMIIPLNKVYGPEFCSFIPKELNALLNDHNSARGKYPQGVSFHEQTKKFRARCNLDGKGVHLGLFDTPEEGVIAYKEFKSYNRS
jgi:hypothetical protein